MSSSQVDTPDCGGRCPGGSGDYLGYFARRESGREGGCTFSPPSGGRGWQGIMNTFTLQTILFWERVTRAHQTSAENVSQTYIDFLILG